MFETFQRLHHWLQANDINKPVIVTFRTDPMTADKIGWALRHECNERMQRMPEISEPIQEGQIYSITFKIEPKQK